MDNCHATFSLIAPCTIYYFETRPGFFFVHFLGGWLRIFPPVAWVIFLKLLELFQNLELFEKILTEHGYFLFKSLKFVHKKWCFLWDISFLAFLFHSIKKNPRFTPFRQFFALKLSKKPPVPWVFSQKFLELFWKIPWVVFRLSYYGLELFGQRTKKACAIVTFHPKIWVSKWPWFQKIGLGGGKWKK